MDDLAMAPMTDSTRRDLLEILDDRRGHRSTLVTSQIPVDSWHAALGDPTLGDAISTGSFTTPIASILAVIRCENAKRV
ncbi:DNA replication protein DnaC [Paraburkholderia sp. GAS199]